ncbi:MarR family winged helix-turn-helix transcriptional regulator [Microbacterium aquilitoris]|uniref:MarR family winged helix-turn-helix transcriptional regulator n=1 Tax=Microbacterium aquilitoris TaxID=3067307 RepID=UPI002890237A|nr:MarR family winged helix-turn-helix transcriptional regulator [Microbacterium sp. KSW2-22]MDT3345059.1 MarR family winged helix-turn-helix transcriptional regulator [Microbacterium sp. KSW2-22]
MTDPTGDLDALLAAFAQMRGRGPHRHHPGGPHAHGPHSDGGGPPWIRGERGFGPGARLAGAPARIRLLDALVHAENPLSVSEIAEAIGVDQPRASRLVQQAVELGFAAREADPDDARRTRIALTVEGRRRAGDFRGERRERLSQALADFTAEERAELVRLLGKLAASWPRG